ncbi:bZIP transcription factor [Colletotrichum tofieldiae]|uniref:BZIP transcription factor n=1 Tax=Colletotrichum tofieldiae TaxID=708197 RepID=A0A166M0D0_9PEZI|nr:bZIP transcription factor [Colletotrichum tofieldiae]
MDFSAGGVPAIHQNNLQQQHQRDQPAWLLQHLPLQQPSGNNVVLFVTPSAWASAPAAPWLTADRQSSTSTQNSQSWQDSPSGNLVESLSSPETSMSSPVDPHARYPAKKSQAVQPVDSTEARNRRRGRPRLSETSQRAGAASTAAKTTKKSKQKCASTASTSGLDDLSSHSGGDGKRNKIRARNRKAAYKCRQKRQKGIKKLQTQEAIIKDINKSLNAEAAMLRDEILMLKHMVLQHSGCRCSFIEDYISGAAQNIVQSGTMTDALTDGGNTHISSQPCMAGANDEGYID